MIGRTAFPARTALLLIALGGCSGGATVPTAPTVPATPTDGKPTVAAEDPNAKRVAAMLKKVETTRKLPALTAVRSKTMDRPALVKQVTDHSKDETPPDAVRGQGELLVAYGLIPAAYDYEKGVTELLEQQLAGYYEPADKTMYLAGDLGGDDADATLAHELVHALQDQHYDLGPKIAYAPDGGDRIGAVHGLAEGDAMSAMIDVLFADKGMNALDLPEEALAMQMRAQILMSGASKEVPTVLQTSLIAPYIDGLGFVTRLRRKGGWAAVDKAWRSPPTTTEQLLHGDKYDAHEPAIALPGPDLGILGGGFRVLFSDLFGEESLRLVFEEWGRRKDAEAFASGWGGDRASVLVRDRGGVEERLAVWHIRWDPDACGNARRSLGLFAHGVSPAVRQDRVTAAGQLCRDRTDLGPLAAVVRGCDLVLVGGPFARKADGKPESRASCVELDPWLSGGMK